MVFNAQLLAETLNQPVSPMLLAHVSHQASRVISCHNVINDDASDRLPVLPSFIDYLVRRSSVRPGTLLGVLIFLERLQRRLAPIAKGMPCTCHRIFLATLIVTSKALHDTSPKNKHWARYAAYFSLAEVNLMESQLLSLLNYRTLFTLEDLHRVFTRYELSLRPPSPALYRLDTPPPTTPPSPSLTLAVPPQRPIVTLPSPHQGPIHPPPSHPLPVPSLPLASLTSTSDSYRSGPCLPSVCLPPPPVTLPALVRTQPASQSNNNGWMLPVPPHRGLSSASASSWSSTSSSSISSSSSSSFGVPLFTADNGPPSIKLPDPSFPSMPHTAQLPTHPQLQASASVYPIRPPSPIWLASDVLTHASSSGYLAPSDTPLSLHADDKLDSSIPLSMHAVTQSTYPP